MTSKLVVSLDFELGWGVLDSPQWRHREAKGLYRNLRPVLAEVFGRLEEWECPTTWACVGSMFQADISDSGLYYLPPIYRQAVTNFITQSKESTRDARDIMEKWGKLEGFSEICSHTSTHIYPSVPGATGEQYAMDVERSCSQLNSYFKRDIQSLVFTRDDATYLPQVLDRRSLNVRLGPENYYSPSANRLSRIKSGAFRYFQTVPESKLQLIENGGTSQSGSLYFNWSGGDFEGLKKVQVQLQAKRVLKLLASSDKTFHIWIHPFNLAESAYHQTAFLDFLCEAVKLRDKGSTEILTMSNFAELARSEVI